jgi:CDP-diacylglycerol--serine O-phosphatidyltransferase
MIIGKWNKSVIVTYIGVMFSIVGMYFAFANGTKYAMCCLMAAGICDLFDGRIARSCKRTEEEKKFGVELDSLADVFNFIAFPIVIFIGAGFAKPYFILLCILFAVCGIARLAYFNISAEDDTPVRFYQGLPVTYTALILPIIYLLKSVLSPNLFYIVFPAALLVISILNIHNIKVPKPKGAAYIVFSLSAVFVLVLYLVVL